MPTDLSGGATRPGEFDPAFDGSEPIRQGDVLRFRQPLAGEPWAAHFGLVVTANCDLVHRKHGGILTYVPVVPIEAYLRLIYVPRTIARHEARARDALRDQLPADSPWPRIDRLEEMLAVGTSLDKLLAVLPADGNTPQLSSVVEYLYRAAREAHRDTPPDQITDVLATLDDLVRLQNDTNRRRKPHRPMAQLRKRP